MGRQSELAELALALGIFLILILPAFSVASIYERTPAILPASPLYGAKLTAEHIGLAFSFGSKPARLMGLADGRLAELRAMADANRTAGLPALSAEYSFLIDEYLKNPEAPEDFSRHAENLLALEDYLKGVQLGERERLGYSVLLGSLRLRAELAGSVPRSPDAYSAARIEAVAALEQAENAVAAYLFSHPHDGEPNRTLAAARSLLEDGAFRSSASVSRRLVSELAG